MHPIRLYSVPIPDDSLVCVVERRLEAEDRYRGPIVARPGKVFYSLDMGGLDDADAQLEAHRIHGAIVRSIRARAVTT